MTNGLRTAVLTLALCAGLHAQSDPAFTAPLTAASTNCTTIGSCISVDPRGTALYAYSSVAIQVSGAWAATLQFESSVDCVNWTAAPATPVAGGSTVTSTTANGQWTASIQGYCGFRARVSAYTSGNAQVTLRPAAQPGGVALPPGAVVSGPNLTLPGTLSVGNPAPATTPPAGSTNIQGNYYQNGVLFSGGAGGGCPVSPFSALFAGATTSNGSLGCGLTYVSALHTDFAAVATTQSIKLGTAASLFSVSGVRIEETTTLISGSATVTAVQACVGTLASPCLFTPGGLALFAGQFATFPGPFSGAVVTTPLATQDIYLTMTVTNAAPGNLSTMTGVTGTVTARIWGGVAQ